MARKRDKTTPPIQWAIRDIAGTETFTTLIRGHQGRVIAYRTFAMMNSTKGDLATPFKYMLLTWVRRMWDAPEYLRARGLDYYFVGVYLGEEKTKRPMTLGWPIIYDLKLLSREDSLRIQDQFKRTEENRICSAFTLPMP